MCVHCLSMFLVGGLAILGLLLLSAAKVYYRDGRGNAISG